MTTFTDRLGGVRSELSIKAPCRVATTSNITLSGFQTIDGVTLADGDPNLRVLVKDQTDATTNGVYDAQSGIWTRSLDFDGNTDFVYGTRLFVTYGTTTVGQWITTATDPITVGTSSISFTSATQVDDASQSQLVSAFDYMTSLQIADVQAATLTLDVTTAVQSALDSGKDVYFPKGSYLVSALTLSSNGVRLTGEGLLYKKASTIGRTLTVSGDYNYISLKFDGTATQSSHADTNSTLVITGDSNTIDSCHINGGAADGISVIGGAGNKIVNNTVLNTYSNSVYICNDGANDNVVMGNYLSGTTTQNNVFITGINDTSAPARNRIIGNHCIDSGDTGIESGYHTYNTVIEGNTVKGSANPAILLRDCYGVIVANNFIRHAVTAGQTSGYSGIAVVPQVEAESWQYYSTISGNTILGAVNRAGIALGGSCLTCTNNLILDDVTSVDSAGVGLSQNGINVPTVDAFNLVIKGNYIQNFSTAINLNWGGTATALAKVDVTDNFIYRVAHGINLVSLVLTDGNIRDNTFIQIKNNCVEGTSATVTNVAYFGNYADTAGWTASSPGVLNPTTIAFIGVNALKINFNGSTSGGTNLVASAVATGTLTLPAATDTLVGKATTDTLTNKTLTAPVLTTPAIGVATGTKMTITPAADATAGNSSSYPVAIKDAAATDIFLALGYDGSASALLQSFGGKYLAINSQGNSMVLGAGLATNATTGFPYIPSCAGTPSGTPTAISDMCPIVYDRTNNIIYVNNAGTWKKTVALT